MFLVVNNNKLKAAIWIEFGYYLEQFWISETFQHHITIDSMSNFIAKVTERFELETVHISGADIGAPIGLFLASRYSNKLKSVIVIVSGGAAVYHWRSTTFYGISYLHRIWKISKRFL